MSRFSVRRHARMKLSLELDVDQVMGEQESHEEQEESGSSSLMNEAWAAARLGCFTFAFCVIWASFLCLFLVFFFHFLALYRGGFQLALYALLGTEMSLVEDISGK